jgi:putative membrane fusion protein
VVLKQGSVELTADVEGLVVRQERVYTAPAAGSVRRVAAEGQRVRVGAPAAEIVAPGSVPAQQAAPATGAKAPAQGDAAVRRRIDDLGAAMYQKAAAITEAKSKGDATTAAALQAELDQLGLQQQQLARQLNEQAPAVVPAVPAAPAAPQGPALGTVTVDMAGLLTYQLDGLESALSPARAKDWKPSTVKALTAQLQAIPDVVAKGDPVLKVVDNLSLTLIAVVPDAVVARLGGEKQVSLRFAGREGPPVVAQISRQVSEGGEVLLVLTAPVFPEELAQQRNFRATVVLGGASGLLVPRTAIDVRGGLQGVWVVAGTERTFHPARVLGGNDNVVALETDLTVGTRVLATAPTSMR